MGLARAILVLDCFTPHSPEGQDDLGRNTDL